MRGGKVIPGPGKTLGRNTKPEDDKMVKKQFLITPDQVKFIKSLGRYKGSSWAREAIEEKRLRENPANKPLNIDS